MDNAKLLKEFITERKADEAVKIELDDIYHTLNELYEHRVTLFSTITNQNKDISWKSYSNHDGTAEPDCFVVGIDTGYGEFVYRFPANYWGWFDVPTLDRAPQFDESALNDVTRLLALRKRSPKEKEFDGMKRIHNKFINGEVTRNEFLRGVMNRLAKHSIGKG